MLLNNIIKGDQQSNDEQELLKTPKYNDIMRSEEERVTLNVVSHRTVQDILLKNTLFITQFTG